MLKKHGIIRGLIGGFLLGILVPATGAVVGTILASLP